MAALGAALLAGAGAPSAWAQGTWGAAAPVAPLGSYGMAVSCATTTWCMAVGAGSAGGGVAAVWTAGAGWRRLGQVDSAQLTAVSCPSTTMCMAGDWSGNALMWNGTSWSAPVTVDGQGPMLSLRAISCPSQSMCMGLRDNGDGQGGAVLWTASSGWASGGAVPDSSVEPLGGSISCPTPTWCMASYDFGQVAVWRARSGWSTMKVGVPTIWAVSCPSPTVCVVAGDTWSNPPGVFAVWRAGLGWATSTVRGVAMEAVSCSTPTWCMAVGEEHNYTTWEGTSWSAPRSLSTAVEDAPLISVSCPATTMCMAVDAGRYVMKWDPQAHPARAAAPRRWSHETGGQA